MAVPVGLSAFTARRGSQAMVVLMDQRRNAVRGRAQAHPTLRFKRLGAGVGFRRGVAAFGKGTTLPRRPRLAAKPHAGAGTAIFG